MTDVRRLAPGDAAGFAAMLDLFAEAFEDPATYCGARPGPSYRDALLAEPGFAALVAMADGAVVGALAAYELRKFERERSEFYIYDLAVTKAHRRRGVATAMIDALRRIAAGRAAVVFVQADHGDDAAVALYTKLGVREDVMHFDIPVGG